MKAIKFTLTAALFAVVIATTAVERPKVTIIPVAGEKAIVAVNNEEAAYFELGIYTVAGEMVYYRQAQNRLKDYSQVFNFKNLDKGKYILSLKINDTRVTNEFEVSGEGVQVGQKKIVYDPYFSYENNELKLSYLNFDNESLKLSVYNRKGMVYEKNLGKEFNILKGFDLSKLEKGTYEVVLSSENKEFSYNVVK